MKYPVAASDIAAGAPISADVVDWIDLPADALPPVDLAGASAVRDIAVGEPIAASALAGPVVPPDEWWVVPIEVGSVALTGDEVMLVIVDPPLTAYGVVVSPQIGERFSVDFRAAAVAVPPDVAPAIASAARDGALTTAVRTAGINR